MESGVEPPHSKVGGLLVPANSEEDRNDKTENDSAFHGIKHAHFLQFNSLVALPACR